MIDLTREPTYSDDGDCEGSAPTAAGLARPGRSYPSGSRGGESRAAKRVTSVTKKKKKKKDKLDFKETLDDITYEELAEMAAANSGSVGLECVDVINSIRVNSSSFQGTWSSRMWTKIKKVKDVIRALVAKTELYGDSTLLEARIIEKTAELSAAKREAADRKEENRKLKKENEELRRSIKEMKSEIINIKEISRENADLWKEIKALKVELQSLKRGDLPVENSGKGKDRKGKATGLGKRLTFRGDVSPEAGPSGLTLVGSPFDEGPVNPIPENKAEAERQVLGMVEQLKNVRKGKDNRGTGGKSLGSDLSSMDWEPLPQRVPRSGEPRVVSNIQLVPSGDSAPLVAGESTPGNGRKKKNRGGRLSETDGKSDPEDAAWKVVSDRRVNPRGRQQTKNKNKNKNEDLNKNKNRRDSKASQTKVGGGSGRVKASGSIRKPPKTAAVSITGRDKDFSYREALLRARKEISLKDLKIESTRLRRAANGGYIIEIMDKDGADKAASLREKLKALLPEEQAVVACPTTYGEIRLIGLDVTILEEEIAQFIVAEGKCSAADVKVGAIQPMRNGLNSVWARCPLAVACSLASKGKVCIGWSRVRVELLNERPIQCYKCWRYGHVRFACSSSVDRGRSCFNCGREGHALRDCQMSPHCVLCAEDGRNGDHRLGSVSCEVDRKPRRSRGGFVPAKMSLDRGTGLVDANNVQSPAMQR
ncbi:hypothetical protein RF55_9847 [Lasius niger]|uniref:CCHC-type domain-containing protein n=1 Tax=Lasius niger TaxID=67767 RepID=A0A0J7KJJ7_LASNI|nr:hypothetical protein RF55_9847 [Lasius niger]